MTKPYGLIIEDDPTLGEIYKVTLQRAGYETDLDENGDRYTLFLANRRPDIVILDLHLPFAAGSDILDEIRAKYPQTIVIVVTADLIKARDLTGKADHILLKPVSVASLLKVATSVKEAV